MGQFEFGGPEGYTRQMAKKSTSGPQLMNGSAAWLEEGYSKPVRGALLSKNELSFDCNYEGSVYTVKLVAKGGSKFNGDFRTRLGDSKGIVRGHLLRTDSEGAWFVGKWIEDKQVFFFVLELDLPDDE